MLTLIDRVSHGFPTECFTEGSAMFDVRRNEGWRGNGSMDYIMNGFLTKMEFGRRG